VDRAAEVAKRYGVNRIAHVKGLRSVRISGTLLLCRRSIVIAGATSAEARSSLCGSSSPITIDRETSISAASNVGFGQRPSPKSVGRPGFAPHPVVADNLDCSKRSYGAGTQTTSTSRGTEPWPFTPFFVKTWPGADVHPLRRRQTRSSSSRSRGVCRWYAGGAQVSTD